MTAKVKILMIGPTEVLVDGKPISIKRRLNRALLFYLAGQRHPVTRDEVISAFWPEETESRGRKNLREALSRLRTELGTRDLIISVDDQLSVDHELVEVDFREFDRIVTPLLGSSEISGSAILPEWMLLQMKTALEMCRSSQLLQGVRVVNAQGFENWLGLNNQAYSFARLKVIDRLIDHYLTSGDLDQAILWLGRGLEINRFDEEMNFLMLICLRDLGKTREIIDYVNYLEGLYSEQQEALPNRFLDLRKNAEAGKGVSVLQGVQWPEIESGEPRFVGREKYLDLIANTMHRRGIAWLRGESGAGKTRLLKHFYAQQSVSPRLIYVRSDPLCENVAFYALVKAIREQVLPRDWDELDQPDKELLSNFYHHDWQGLTGTQVPRTKDQWLPVFEDVFFAFKKLMTIIATHRPILFILDDAMWLDLASISLVSFLIEQKYFEKHGLLVIVTLKKNVNPALADMIQLVNHRGDLVSIDLAPLSRDEIALLVHNIVGRIPGEDYVEKIFLLTGGVPLFLVNCLRSARFRYDPLEIPIYESCDPPEPLVQHLERELAKLSVDSIELLKAAAILGREFTVMTLEEMKIASGERFVKGLEELTDAGILIPDSGIGSPGGYHFDKEIERMIITSQLSPARKRDLHLRAAKALDKIRERQPSTLAAIATHYESVGEFTNAVERWLSAGRYARSIFSKDDSYKAYGKALALIEMSPRFYDEKLIYDVVYEWGNFTYDQDDMATCEMVYQKCLEFGEVRHSLLLTGLGYSGLGRVAYYKDDFSGAEEAYRKAIYYLSQTGHKAAHINALSALGFIRFGLDEYSQALELLDEALKLGEGDTDPESLESRINISTYMCAMLCFTGDITRSNALAVEMARRLLGEGIYVVGFSFPVVPKGQARIRVQLCALHADADIDRALEAFAKVGRELGAIA